MLVWSLQVSLAPRLTKALAVQLDDAVDTAVFTKTGTHAQCPSFLCSKGGRASDPPLQRLTTFHSFLL